MNGELETIVQNMIGVEPEDNIAAVIEEYNKSIDFEKMDKENDMTLHPDRYDDIGNLKPEFEMYVDAKGISRSKKARKKTDVSIDEDVDYEFRIDKTKDKVSQVIDIYNTVNKDNKEVQGLLKWRFNQGQYGEISFEDITSDHIQDAVETVQGAMYGDIKYGMNPQELDDMYAMLEKKYNMYQTDEGRLSIRLPEVVIEDDANEATKIDIQRAKEVQRLLSNVDVNNEEVKEEIAKQYFDFSGIPFRGGGSAEDKIYDERLFKRTLGLEKWLQWERWNKTGELPSYTSTTGIGISEEMVDNAIGLVKDRSMQTYNESLSDDERLGYMKHIPSAIPNFSFVDYYKRREQDEVDFKTKYGYTLTHKQKGTHFADDRVYIPVNDYGADWAKHFWKAQNQSSGDYIKGTTDRVIADDKKLKVEIDKFNKLNDNLLAKSAKLNKELENLGVVTSDSPADVIHDYNAIVGELKVLSQNIKDRGLNDIYVDISRRSEKLRAEIDNLGDVAEANEDLSIIGYANGLNYSNLDRMLASIEKGLINPAGVLGADVIDAVTNDKWDLSNKMIKHSIETDEDFEENFSRNLSFSWQNLDIWLPQALANNSASIAAVGSFFVNPLAGYSLFFSMGYGHKVTDIERNRQAADKQISAINLKLSKAITNDEKLALQKQKEDWRRKRDISFWQQRGSGILAGGSEVIWERLGSVNAIKNFQKWSRVIGKGTFKRTMGIGYGLGLTQVVEYGEELGTEITNNIFDHIVLKEDKSIWDGIDKDFSANVIVTGLALQGPNMGQTTWNLFSEQVRTRDQKRINRERLQRITEIDKRLQNPLTLNSVEVERLEKEKIDLIEAAGIETVMNIDKLNSLTFEEKQAVFEKARQAQETLRELEALGATGDITSNYAI